jgi:RimJ/RimL family protein N-acetyltransferase
MKRFKLPKVLKGPRIELVELTQGMEREILALIESSRGSLGEFMEWGLQKTSAGKIRKTIAKQKEKMKKGELFSFSIQLGKQIIGRLEVHQIDWEHSRCELGYWLGTEFTRHGYATEAVKVVEAALYERGFHRIAIICEVKNKASSAVAMRAGYDFEAHLRERKFIRGQFVDEFQYVKVKSEWERQK